MDVGWLWTDINSSVTRPLEQNQEFGDSDEFDGQALLLCPSGFFH